MSIGTYSFGGGVAILGVMEREFVERYRCLPAQEFLHGVSLGQFLGSFAVNTAFFVGHRLRGFWGGLVSIISFLAPSVTLVILLAWLTHSAKELPTIQNGLVGMAPVVVALIVSAATALARSALRHRTAWALAAVGLVGTIMRISLPLLLFLGAFVGYLLHFGSLGRKAELPSTSIESQGETPAGKNGGSALGVLPVATATTSTTAAMTMGVTTGGLLGLLGVGWLFLRVGLIFVGGGYVLVPLLQHELVESRHLLSHQDFLEGLAISQLTPGPIAVLATYAGFRLAGALGAIAATTAIYAPATALMTLLCHAYEKFHRLERVRDALEGSAAVVVGMILASAVSLAPHSGLMFTRPLGIALALCAYLLLQRKWHPALVLFAGFMLGILTPNAFAS